MSTSSPLGVGPLYVKSFGSLLRATPLRETEARKWSIGDGFNDYRTLGAYLQAASGDHKEIAAKARISGVNHETDMEVIEDIVLPTLQRGSFLPEDELKPLMEKHNIPDMEALEMRVYWILFRTTNHGTELRVVQ